MFNIIRAELYRLLKGRSFKLLIISLLTISAIFFSLAKSSTNKENIINTYSNQESIDVNKLIEELNNPIDIFEYEGFDIR